MAYAAGIIKVFQVTIKEAVKAESHCLKQQQVPLKLGVGCKGTDAWLPVAAPVEGQKGMLLVLTKVTNHFSMTETVLVLVLKAPCPVP